MKIYLIEDVLKESSIKEAQKHDKPYVAIATAEEFYKHNKFFDMGIDLDLDLTGPVTTKAEINYDSIIGTFNVPNRNDILEMEHSFAYALDEKGIVFLGDDGYAQKLIDQIIKTKKWRFPSLERFIFDFLEQITDQDLAMLEGYEAELDKMEEDIQGGKDTQNIIERLLDLRSALQYLRLNYEQLSDLTQELEENENNFFKEENLRFFGLYGNRITRLLGIVNSVKEHTIQVRELYHTSLEAKQNRLVAILTVIATIFMPLTLIAGWYGMNFVYMPELQYKYSYPIVIGISIAIVVGCIVYFKKNKWL